MASVAQSTTNVVNALGQDNTKALQLVVFAYNELKAKNNNVTPSDSSPEVLELNEISNQAKFKSTYNAWSNNKAEIQDPRYRDAAKEVIRDLIAKVGDDNVRQSPLLTFLRERVGTMPTRQGTGSQVAPFSAAADPFPAASASPTLNDYLELTKVPAKGIAAVYLLANAHTNSADPFANVEVKKKLLNAVSQYGEDIPKVLGSVMTDLVVSNPSLAAKLSSDNLSTMVTNSFSDQRSLRSMGDLIKEVFPSTSRAKEQETYDADISSTPSSTPEWQRLKQYSNKQLRELVSADFRPFASTMLDKKEARQLLTLFIIESINRNEPTETKITFAKFQDYKHEVIHSLKQLGVHDWNDPKDLPALRGQAEALFETYKNTRPKELPQLIDAKYYEAIMKHIDTPKGTSAATNILSITNRRMNDAGVVFDTLFKTPGAVYRGFSAGLRKVDSASSALQVSPVPSEAGRDALGVDADIAGRANGGGLLPRGTAPDPSDLPEAKLPGTTD